MDLTQNLVVTAPSRSLFLSYWALMKPRVMALVIFTALCGMICAPTQASVLMQLLALFLIALGAGGSAVLNMWYERDLDAVMQRTRSRPLPQGEITANEALIFGMMLSYSSVFLMALFIGYIPAFLLGVTIYFYAYFYTAILKPLSSQNIVWGGIAGALPPIIGWFSVTTTFSWVPIYLFGLIFFWTIPHFWALSIHFLDDYTKAKIPMLPVVKGVAYTRNKIFLYTLITSIFACLPYITQQTLSLCAGLIFLLSARFVHIAWQIKTGIMHPMALFKFSILYLFLLMVLITVDINFSILRL